jgi:hypothetical protein
MQHMLSEVIMTSVDIPASEIVQLYVEEANSSNHSHSIDEIVQLYVEEANSSKYGLPSYGYLYYKNKKAFIYKKDLKNDVWVKRTFNMMVFVDDIVNHPSITHKVTRINSKRRYYTINFGNIVFRIEFKPSFDYFNIITIRGERKVFNVDQACCYINEVLRCSDINEEIDQIIKTFTTAIKSPLHVIVDNTARIYNGDTLMAEIELFDIGVDDLYHTLANMYNTLHRLELAIKDKARSAEYTTSSISSNVIIRGDNFITIIEVGDDFIVTKISFQHGKEEFAIKEKDLLGRLSSVIAL